jgi:flagellar biogenesis protein FliO
MLAMFANRLARCQSGPSDFTGITGAFARWLSLPARRAEPTLKLLERVPLTAQASLALVRFGQQNLVLGVTAQRISLLAKGETEDFATERRADASVKGAME